MSKSGFSRMQIRRHNGHLGRVEMMRRMLIDIITSETATDLSKNIASSMLDQCDYLRSSLKTRKEPSPCKPSPDANI